MSEEVEKCLRMLQVHNSKVGTIRAGYNNYCALRQQANAEGVSFEELKKRQESEVKVGKAATKKVSGIAAAKKKFAAKAK